MSVARFAFQACSFNHSDISPSLRINKLRAVLEPSIAHAGEFPYRFSNFFAFNGLTPCDDEPAL